MGVIPADAGTIQVNGRTIRYSDAAYKTDIGYIPEDPFFYENLKIGEFLAYNALFYPSWDARKAGAYLDRFSLNPKASISTLSRGMKLKLGLVTALSANPSLLILDDPTSGLDVPTRQDFLKDIIRELAEGGRRSCSPRTSSMNSSGSWTGSTSLRPGESSSAITMNT